ncbi:MAG: DUF6390 family protein [Nocardioidaceae bacterium]
MSAQGARQFARYAYPPNELGYCGPLGAREMLDPAAVELIGQRARQFEGAWVYLELLAEVLGLVDPLAREVVDAYWVGSDLLDQGPPGRGPRAAERRASRARSEAPGEAPWDVLRRTTASRSSRSTRGWPCSWRGCRPGPRWRCWTGAGSATGIRPRTRMRR